MKKALKILSLSFGLTLIFSTISFVAAVEAKNYSDVDSSEWYSDEVSYVSEHGLMNGMSETDFMPQGTTTRGMLVTVLYRLDGSEKVEALKTFKDVEEGAYYELPIEWAAKNKIVNGIGNGEFRPNDPITREQIAAIFYRYAEFKGYSIANKGDLEQYDDSNAISEYAKQPMAWAIEVGLMNGMTNTTLEPKQNATRAQIATVLYRFCESEEIKMTEPEPEIEKEYKVVFNLNYNDKILKEVNVKEETEVDKPGNPTRSGYDFKGWYTKASGGSKFDFETKITEE